MLGLGSSLFHPAEAEKFSFTNINGLKLWLKPGSTLDSTAASWRDSSGQENNATQATSGDQADVVANYNGIANGGLDFEESEGDHYDLGSAINIDVNTGWCVAGAVKIESYDSTQNCLLSSASNKFFEWQTDDKIRINYTNTVTVLMPTVNNVFATGSLFTFIVARNDSGVHTLYKNGGSVALDTGNSLNITNTVASSFNAIGQREKTGPDRQFDGILYELAIWDVALATRSINAINEDLARRYGVPGAL